MRRLVDAREETARLMLQYLAGDLDAQGLEKLNASLRADPQVCREAASVLLQDLQLREIGAASNECALLSDTTRPAALQELFDSLRSWGAMAGSRPAWGATFAAILIALGSVLLFRGRGGNSLQVTQTEGTVLIGRGNRQFEARKPAHLRAGDQIVLGTDAVAIMEGDRGRTVIHLSHSTRLTVEAFSPKTIHLERGLLSARVAPQRTPALIRTSQATATIKGTELVLEAANDSTRLEVWEGNVQFVESATKGSAEVGPNQVAVAAAGSPLDVQPLRHGVLREYWLEITGSHVTDLTADRRYPSAPTGKDLLSAFEAPSNWADAYGTRISGYLRAWVTGDYRFWIAADDEAELWLSSDDDPRHKVRICLAKDWSQSREWDKSPEQSSAPVRLQAGGKYYIEAVHKQSGGADCLAVAWKAPGGQREIISGDFLSPVENRALPSSVSKAGNRP
jgi:hypothetical protein